MHLEFEYTASEFHEEADTGVLDAFSRLPGSETLTLKSALPLDLCISTNKKLPPHPTLLIKGLR